MVRLLALLFISLVCLFPGVHFSEKAFAQSNELVDGSINASWRNAEIVSTDADAIVRPGMALKVQVSEQVDINQVERSRRSCSLFGLRCKTHRWIEHHFRSPSEQPIELLLKPLDDDESIIAAVIGEEGSVQVPGTVREFEKEYQILGRLYNPSGAIDPARSFGSFVVEIEVGVGSRIQLFRRWLRESPSVQEIIEATGESKTFARLDPLAIADAIAQYSTQISMQPARRLELLNHASTLAPDSPVVAAQLARLYSDIGLREEAEEELQRAIELSSQSSEPASKFATARLLENMAELQATRLLPTRKSGLSRAISYLTQAISTYSELQMPAEEARVLRSQAHLFMQLRDRRSLQRATENLARATTLSPRIEGEILVPGQQNDPKVFGNITSSMGLIKAQESRISLGGGADDLWPASRNVDFERRRILVQDNRSLAWLSLDEPDVLPEIIARLSPSNVITGGDTIIATSEERDLSVITGEGQVFDLVDGPFEACRSEVPSNDPVVVRNRIASPEVIVYEGMVSRDGQRFAIHCRKSIMVVRVEDSGPVVEFARQQPDSVRESIAAGGPGVETPRPGPGDSGTAWNFLRERPGAPPVIEFMLLKRNGQMQSLHKFEHPTSNWVRRSVFTESGRLVLVDDFDRVLRVFDGRTGAREREIELPEDFRPGGGQSLIEPGVGETVYLPEREGSLAVNVSNGDVKVLHRLEYWEQSEFGVLPVAFSFDLSETSNPPAEVLFFQANLELPALENGDRFSFPVVDSSGYSAFEMLPGGRYVSIAAGACKTLIGDRLNGDRRIIDWGGDSCLGAEIHRAVVMPGVGENEWYSPRIGENGFVDGIIRYIGFDAVEEFDAPSPNQPGTDDPERNLIGWNGLGVYEPVLQDPALRKTYASRLCVVRAEGEPLYFTQPDEAWSYNSVLLIPKPGRLDFIETDLVKGLGEVKLPGRRSPGAIRNGESAQRVPRCSFWNVLKSHDNPVYYLANNRNPKITIVDAKSGDRVVYEIPNIDQMVRFGSLTQSEDGELLLYAGRWRPNTPSRIMRSPTAFAESGIWRLQKDGTILPACSKCNLQSRVPEDVPLPAMNFYNGYQFSPLQFINGLRRYLSHEGPIERDMIVDAAGEIVARREGDFVVVERMIDGEQFLRVAYARLLSVSREELIVRSANGAILVYPIASDGESL